MSMVRRRSAASPPWSRKCAYTDTTGMGRRAMKNHTAATPWNENCQTSRTADFGKRVPASQLSLREVLHRAQPPISDVDTSSTYEDDLRNLLVQILRSGYHTRPRTSRRWTLLEE
ncbi:uncharacterized protein LOC144911010 isoform X2 [Branchiostoma floridae x Branchiostoma belcheri]